MKIVVTVPTYNEIENIESLIAEILAQDDRIEVLVADDDSPDGTWQAVAALAITEPRVHLLHRKTMRGRGHAGKAAYLWAIEKGADLAFEMDADFSHHPTHLPAMIDALADHDVVLGSRQVEGGEDTRPAVLRRWLTRASNLYARTLLGLPVADCNSGFRGFRKEALVVAGIDAVFSPGPAIVHELLFRARLAGCTMTEIPITFVDRDKGESTLTFATLLRSYVTILRLRCMAWTGKLAPPSKGS